MKKVMSVILAVPMLAVSFGSWLSPALANGGLSVLLDEVTTNSTNNYWTPERLRNAKPKPLPKARVNPSGERVIESTSGSVRGTGQAPTVKINPDTQSLFTGQTPDSDEVEPNNVGSRGAQFTSSRVVPETAAEFYPYATAGKLFFKQGNANYICSAAVLRPRIILTAGHCVHSGSGGSTGFFSNFIFIPAYNSRGNYNAPYLRWNASRVVTTNTWATGNGAVPNAADYAILELTDQRFNGTTRRIGDVTGYLGYATNKLIPNHSTIIGYPGNLDNGDKMHIINSESYGSGGNNTATYGSDMRGGSSGGPWIENFGVPAVGQVDGLNRTPNQIVGVTSYGPTAVGPLYQGSSILDSRFIDILNIACGWNSRNCQ